MAATNSSASPPAHPHYLTVGQFAARWGWCETTVNEMTNDGRILAFLPNGHGSRGKRIPMWEVERFEREGPRPVSK